MEKTKRNIFDAILKLPMDERAKAYVNLNCYDWPETLIEFKPSCFPNKPRKEQRENEIYQFTWKILQSMVSNYDKSKMWWEMKVVGTNAGGSIKHTDWYFEEMLKVYEGIK